MNTGTISRNIFRVIGRTAPFNSTKPEDARYYHSLGLYFPCTIGGARVLLVKSGLHFDHDLESVVPGGTIPFARMLTEMIGTLKPKLFITTGTGGAIGKDVKLKCVEIGKRPRRITPEKMPNRPRGQSKRRPCCRFPSICRMLFPDR
jgi:hypothetical protein